jgi:hypothetical protein
MLFMPSAKMKWGDCIAAVAGIALLTSFFIPIGWYGDWFDESMFSVAMSRIAEEKTLFVFPAMGAMLLGAAFIFHLCNAYSWLRAIYLVPTVFMVITILVEISESRGGFVYIGLMTLIEVGGIAMLLLLGGVVGGAVAAFVGAFSKRASRSR